MYDAFILAINDNGTQKFFSCDDGWTTDKEQACWFPTEQDAMNQAFDEGLDDDEATFEGVCFE